MKIHLTAQFFNDKFMGHNNGKSHFQTDRGTGKHYNLMIEKCFTYLVSGVSRCRCS